MKTIRPCLLFVDQAEQAAEFYVSIFNNAKIGSIMHHGDAGPGAKGSVLLVTFELDGEEFIALNGPRVEFSPAVSFFVTCQTQEEVDRYWHTLSEGGQTNRCGWLTDRFGVSWQIVPSVLCDMLQDKDASKADRVMQAMMQMTKLDIATLRQAYEQA